MLNKSEYLVIEFRDGTFLQTWSGLKMTEDEFKVELIQFLNMFIKYSPKNVLWDNRKFNFFIPKELNEWIQKEIMFPQYKNGIDKLAFVVTPDIRIQQNVIKSVEAFKPYNKPRFFLTLKQAFLFINSNIINTLSSTSLNNLSIEQTTINNDKIELHINNNNLEDIIVALHEINAFKTYREKFIKTYKSLTLQEKVIIRKIVYGNSSKEIASILNIQTDTVNTHRKNLKRKINYNNNYELTYFAKAFGIISF